MMKNSPVLRSRHGQPWSVGANASEWGSIASTSVPSSSTFPLLHIGTRWIRRRKHLCVSKFICRIDFSRRNISHFYPLVKHDKYFADSMTSIMTGDVIINTEVNIDEILELENQQQVFKAVCLVCSINHRITESCQCQTIKNQSTLIRCDAMPSDDTNSRILMDMSLSIQGCFVHTVWVSSPINGVAFHKLSWYWQQNSALATSLIDYVTRIRITVISCLKDELVVDRSYRCHR